MLDYSINFISHLGHWGYLVIFLVVALECQALLGLVIPGESLVLVGGFFAEQGEFDLDILIFVISIAAILDDSIGYGLGRHLLVVEAVLVSVAGLGTRFARWHGSELSP